MTVVLPGPLEILGLIAGSVLAMCSTVAIVGIVGFGLADSSRAGDVLMWLRWPIGLVAGGVAFWLLTGWL